MQKIISNILVDHKIETPKQKLKTLHIRNIGKENNIEDIRNAIINTLQTIEPDKITIKALRPTNYGSQVATVLIGEEDAHTLIAQKKMRIGLNICQIEERINVKKCYKCWEYGHFAGDCQNEDRSKLCRNCGKPDHDHQNCKNESFCPLCDKSGHTAGFGGCNLFKIALKSEREKIKNNTN